VNFFVAALNQYKLQIAELVFDYGTELGGQKLTTVLKQKGCNNDRSAPYHHTQNGTAECANGVILQL
jgi:hypothetical protein